MSALEDIKARAEKATPGPWEVSEDPLSAGDWIVRELHPEIDAPDGVAAGVSHESTAEFIAQARTDVPKLLAALEAVEKLAKEWQKTPKKPTTFDAALHHASIQIQTVLMEATR